MNSSGSLPFGIDKTRTSKPAFLSISSPLIVAICPAISASYDITTLSAYLFNNLAWLMVSAVPKEATTLVIPLWYKAIKSI